MDSDSEQSDNDQSRFSLLSSNQNTTDDSRHNQSELADESIIAPRRKKLARKPVLESDSDSESEKSKSESEHSQSDQSKSENELTEDEDEDEDENERSKHKSHSASNSDAEQKSDDGSEESDSDAAHDTTNFDAKNADDTKVNSMLDRSARSNKSMNGSRDESESSLPQSSPSMETSEVIPATDDEDDDEEHERSELHVFSPRTRRSISGRRSMKFQRIESDEDEILSNEHNSESNASHSTGEFKSAEASKLDESTNENDRSEHVDRLSINKRNRSFVPNDSITIKTPNAKRFSLNVSNQSQSLITSTPSRSTPDIEFSDRSDDSKSSVLQIEESHSETDIKSILQDSSIVLLNSSDEENHALIANNTTNVGASTSTGRLIQPKLPFGKLTTKQFVSRDYYNQKVDALAKAKQERIDAENLLQQVGSTLPDGGINLKRRIQLIELEVNQKQMELNKYAIEEENLHEAMAVETANGNHQSNKNNLDWRNELESIQPRFTGQIGLTTFNTQKTLTLNRIEKLHKAMEKCPTETDLAKQPDNLNVQLMVHQLHAIKWMRWREAQKPKGGLLADDMGLGKTLTVIGLVLDAKYRKNLSIAEEDEDDTGSEDGDKDDDDDSDDENERGYKKSFASQGGTLIVCPASLINQWEKEVENRVKRRKLTVLMHHGKRNESIHSICKYDLVITTYGVVSSDHKNNGAIFRIRWERVVLDEAHMIRNHSTAVSKGCCSLRSTMRWGLTGTPIQNKHMDVYSMLKFLRVTPFDDLATFKKWIDPKTEAGMSRLHNILKPLLLRRTKTELQIKGELQALPTKTMNIEDIELSADEASVYTKILAYSQDLFAQYMDQHQDRDGGTKIKLPDEITRRLQQIKQFGRGQEVKSSQILVLLLRLRQICDHPGLIHQMLQDECDLEDDDEEDTDSLDMNIVKQMIGLKINEGDNEDEKKHVHNNSSTKSSNVLVSTNKVYDFKQPSSKCKRVIEIVKRILRETNDKVVVVSQWTSFLGIVADFLNRERVHYVELTGKTPIKDRNNIVVSFNRADTSERVLMLSLVAGGVGLNLTGANHLILLDPHWNPQLESQAFDRVYRVGQRKDVQIYKLLCIKTVEKRIQEIQENKLALSDNVLTGSKSTGSKLSMQDMRRLFDM